MTNQSITLNLPEHVYAQVQQTAEAFQQPIEALIIDAVEKSLPRLDDLPPELVDDIAALPLLNDAALWAKARETLSKAEQARLSDLLYQNSEGLITADERRELDKLVEATQRIMLIRAEVAVLLKQRGYDVSDPTILDNPPDLP